MYMRNVYVPFVLCSIFLALVGYIYLSSNSQTQLKTVSSPETITTNAYTLANIALHASESDCWMGINGAVYDVTEYIDQHPDGKSILRGCGTDATLMYEQVRKHTREANRLLPQYKIGLLK